MKPKTFLVATAFLVPTVTVPAAAQAPRTGGIAVTAQQTPRSQVQIGYTGVEFGFAASVGADGALTQSHPVVRAVSAESPGQRAGIRPGDVIVEVNGTDSRAERALWLEPGVRYTLRVRTGDQEREVVIVPLAERPAPVEPKT